MGICRLPRIDLYWSAQFANPFINDVFSRDRFQLLLACFCVTKPISDVYVNDPESHTIELISYLNTSFRRHFNPSQSLTFDEMMAAYKGKAGIRQYIPMKPHKWGYKIWCLASCNYALRIELYTGADDEQVEVGKTHDLIMAFMDDYHHRNYVLYMDSFFTSPRLLNDLHAKGVAACGSVRLNRRGMPPSTQLNKRTMRSMTRGQSLHYQKNNLCLAVWKDQNVLKVLYNHIQPTTSPTTLKRWGDNSEKIDVPVPQAIHDYFFNAKSVDVLGQLRYTYPIGRKAMNPTSRLVSFLIDMCIVNAYVLHCIGREGENQLRFRLSLMHELTESFRSQVKVAEESAGTRRGAALAKDHYPVHAAVIGDCACKEQHTDKRARTRIMCATCNKHLCIGDCFRIYHE
jgi:hypothetical protein